MKFCPKCGVSVKDEAQFCNKCGYDFNLNKSQNTENHSLNYEEVEEETPAFKYTLKGE
ncbi:zinc-ribbon domain-containing protein [Clostridium tyrobutyricum]|uniref:zinc-ribbon domain-containing protein n=1 Tax=Clostridium tyrobutyricum TaxID=1519 RepID=UPI00164D9074|nr:zinc ribbon domain-containing protein [Clostridium tyrobutyricum]